VRNLELTSLRRAFAVVLQDVHLFSGTVLENLSFGADTTPRRCVPRRSWFRRTTS
jgi:ABC-type multidrug transport system fused ATPase/permease subunit